MCIRDSYKVALDASKLTGGKAKGVAEFEFSTPKLRFSYNPCWLQQSDDLKYYVLVGETVSSDYAADDYVEQRLKIKGLLKPEVTWTHSEAVSYTHLPTHQQRLASHGRADRPGRRGPLSKKAGRPERPYVNHS